MFQGVFLVLTMWLTAIVILFVLIRAVMERSLYTDDSLAGGNGAESEPLIGSAVEPIPSADHIAMDRNRESPIAFKPRSKRREYEEAEDRLIEYSSVALFFFVFLPIFMWINCLNVSDWHQMYPSMIIERLTRSYVVPWNLYIPFQCSMVNIVGGFVTETCFARIYYDLLLWYIFVFATAMFAYFTNKSPTTRIVLQKRVPIGLNLWFFDVVTVTVGEMVFWALWLCVMAFSGYYWVNVHLYDEDDTKTSLERWARYLGILAIMFMTVALFCTTRIRLWNDCFMVSSEHLVAYHKVFMGLMLLAGYCHLALWIAFWVKTDEADWGPFTVPLSYNADNFTPIVMYYVMIFVVPLAYFVGSAWVVRRRYFEWFYAVHLLAALIMIGSILWHASQSWRYLTPPLALYTVDRMIRLWHSARICRVDALSVTVDGAANPNRVEVAKLAFSVGTYSVDDHEAVFEKLSFKMGQYVFVNISNISLWEWHPFTVAAGEDEAASYLEIQNEGESVSEMGYGQSNAPPSPQWTQLLYLLAQKRERNEIGIHDVEIHIDGPYGKPFDAAGCHRVILVAGGIGITPCHSIFSTLLSRSIRRSRAEEAEPQKKEELPPLPSVDLIWVARDSAMFSAFTQTLRCYEAHNADANNRFSVRLFVTRPNGGGVTQREDANEFNNVVPRTAATMYTHGRPDWEMVLTTISDNGNDPSTTLVFACGPSAMVKEVENVAVRKGARFYSESFMF